MQTDALPAMLLDFYAIRHYKPIALPQYFFPVKLAFDGNLPAAIHLFGFCWFVAFLLYSFLLFRLNAPPIQSALGAAFICSIPWAMNNFHGLTTENLIMASTMAILYHFTRSRMLTIAKHVAPLCLWTFIAISVRPMEAYLMLTIPCLLLLIHFIRTRLLKHIDFACMGIYVTTSLVFLTLGWNRQSDDAMVFALAFATALLVICFFLVTKTRKINARFHAIASTVTALAPLWYAPNLRELIEWAFGSSFILEPGRGLDPARNSATALLLAFTHLGSAPLIAFSALAAVFLLARGMRRSTLLDIALKCLLTIATLLPLIFGIFSFTPDMRYYYATFLILFFFSIKTLLDASPTLLKARVFLVASFALVQLLSQYTLTFAKLTEPKNIFSRLLSSDIESIPLTPPNVDEKITVFSRLLPDFSYTLPPVLPLRHEDPAMTVAKRALPQLKQRQSEYLCLLRIFHDPLSNWDVLTHDPVSSALSDLGQKSINTNCGTDEDLIQAANLTGLVPLLKKLHVKIFAVGPVATDFKLIEPPNPMSDLGLQVKEAYRRGKLAKYGLKKIDVIETQGLYLNERMEFLLMEIE